MKDNWIFESIQSRERVEKDWFPTRTESLTSKIHCLHRNDLVKMLLDLKLMKVKD